MEPNAIDSNFINIVVPTISIEKNKNPIRITYKSPKKYRRAVYKMACFFKREFRCDFLQYDCEEKDPKHVAFLWIYPQSEYYANFRYPCIGATCFRYREWKNHTPGYAMQWIWFHPYFRRKRLLSKSWLNFKQEFGNFLCEGPLSEAMNKFLIKKEE